MDTNPNEKLTTLHHNWFDGSDQRHPRVRTTKVHVFNNFYGEVTSYGVAVSRDADLYPVTTGSAFDPSQFYSYTADNPNDVPSIVTNGAGAGNS